VTATPKQRANVDLSPSHPLHPHAPPISQITESRPTAAAAAALHKSKKKIIVITMTPRRRPLLVSLGAVALLALGVGRVDAYPNLLLKEKRCTLPLQVRRRRRRRRRRRGRLVLPGGKSPTTPWITPTQFCDFVRATLSQPTHLAQTHNHPFFGAVDCMQAGQEIMDAPVVQGKGETVTVRFGGFLLFAFLALTSTQIKIPPAHTHTHTYSPSLLHPHPPTHTHLYLPPQIKRGNVELKSGDPYTPGEKLTVSFPAAKGERGLFLYLVGCMFERERECVCVFVWVGSESHRLLPCC
jgi:hypothetical protein